MRSQERNIKLMKKILKGKSLKIKNKINQHRRREKLLKEHHKEKGFSFFLIIKENYKFRKFYFFFF